MDDENYNIPVKYLDDRVKALNPELKKAEDKYEMVLAAFQRNV